MKIVVEKGEEPEITEIASTLIKAIDDAKSEAEADAIARAEAEAKARAEAAIDAESAEAETETKWDVNAKLEEGEEFPDGDILNDLE